MEMKRGGEEMREQPWNLCAPGMWNSVKAVIASLIGTRHYLLCFALIVKFR